MITTKKRLVGQPLVMEAKIGVNRDTITVSFPRSALVETSLEEGTGYFCITGGIVQLSGSVPSSTIPALVLTDEAFMPQLSE